MSQIDLDFLVDTNGCGSLLENLCLKAHLEHVIFIGSKCKLASGSHLFVVQDVALRIENLQPRKILQKVTLFAPNWKFIITRHLLGVMTLNFGHVVISLDKNVLVDLFLQTLLYIGWQIEHECVHLRHTERRQKKNIKIQFHF